MYQYHFNFLLLNYTKRLIEVNLFKYKKIIKTETTALVAVDLDCN
jgi:hypothetical protein